ncbi:MAG: marine proteobacterial sortase target protein [Brevundimonas sp.]
MKPSPFQIPRRRASPLIGGLSLLLISVMLALSLASVVSARQTAPTDEVASGALLLKTRDGATPAAVQLGTDMEVTITGQTARVKVVQAFRNTGRDWAEATYLYPLPEDGAVDSLKMVIGQRVIIGRINRREAARQIYEQAKAEGRGAGLVEQQRPNLFTNRVANIGPGETVLIEIEYQAPVRRVSGEYSFRLPLVVAPRYVPAAGGAPDVATARAVGAPVLDPRRHAPTNPVSITVHLNPGFAPTGVVSPYHPVRIAEGPGSERTVSLAQTTVPADRDFELRWRSSETDPSVSLFRERVRNHDYLMAVIEPPAAGRRRAPPPPRELIFVIDNSGSMSGDSMDQARESLKLALRSLTPADRFNIIRFDDSMTELFDQPVAATPDQVALALRFAGQLQAQGGTEMLPALSAALVDDTPQDRRRVRQVIFLTDGSISNEDDMLRVLGADRGRSRVFMVGIGSAPNSFLMSRMAEVGRGAYTHIGDSREVAARMSALLDRLTRPVVTDLRVYGQGGDAEFTPVDLPDLYEGEPLVVLGRSGARLGRMTVSGTLDGRPWTRRIDLSQAVEGRGIGKLWGKRRITDIEVASRLGQMTDEAAAEAIAQLGLDFSIVTRETSLVAVDHTPRRPEGARLTEEELPLNLPKGWDFDALFGGPVVNGGADGGAAPADPLEPFGLPQTATQWERTLWSGLGLMMIASLALVIIRRRRVA